MKKFNSLLLVSLTAMTLAGCSFLDNLPHESTGETTNEPSSGDYSSGDTSTSGDGSTGASSSEESNIPEGYIDHDLNTKSLKNNQLPIGNYGDYVEFVSSSNDSKPSDEYSALIKENKGEAKGVYQTTYQVGLEKLFSYQYKTEISISISKDELEKLEYDFERNNRETYRMCDLDVTLDGLHFHFKQVGIRQKGNTSRDYILTNNKVNMVHYKLSFEETFDDEYRDLNEKAKWYTPQAKVYREDRKFFGVSKLNLRRNRNEDTTYIREMYASELYRAYGVPAAKTSVTNFVMKVSDGRVLNHGVYMLTEQIDKNFLKRNLIKSARGGDLYKLTWGNSSEGASFSPNTLSQIGVESQQLDGSMFRQNKKTYDLKTNKDSSNHENLINFINDLSPVRGADAYNFFNERSDIEEFYSFLACSFLMGDPDDLRGNANNAYVYFLGGSNKIIFIPTDMDRTMGATGNSAGCNPTNSHGASTNLYDSRTGFSECGNLFSKTLLSSNSTIIREAYKNRVNQIVNDGWLNDSKFEEQFNVVKANYQDVVSISKELNGSYKVMGLYEGSRLDGDNNLSVGLYFTEKKNHIS